MMMAKKGTKECPAYLLSLSEVLCGNYVKLGIPFGVSLGCGQTYNTSSLIPSCLLKSFPSYPPTIDLSCDQQVFLMLYPPSLS